MEELGDGKYNTMFLQQLFLHRDIICFFLNKKLANNPSSYRPDIEFTLNKFNLLRLIATRSTSLPPVVRQNIFIIIIILLPVLVQELAKIYVIYNKYQ